MSLQLYHPSYENDLLLARWWGEMAQAGELASTFSSPPPLGQFLAGFRPPTSLLVAQDEVGLWFAAWFEPAFSGAFFSVWVGKRRRGSLGALQAWREAAALGLSEYSTLLGVTKQANLLPLHYRLGYKDFGFLPRFFGGQDAWVLRLDKEGLAKHERNKRKCVAA